MGRREEIGIIGNKESMMKEDEMGWRNEKEDGNGKIVGQRQQERKMRERR